MTKVSVTKDGTVKPKKDNIGITARITGSGVKQYIEITVYNHKPKPRYIKDSSELSIQIYSTLGMFGMLERFRARSADMQILLSNISTRFSNQLKRKHFFIFIGTEDD